MYTLPLTTCSAPGYLIAGGEGCCRSGIVEDRLARMRAEVAAGLSRAQKELPTKYLYDARGSRLFEEITHLPEYYPTRAERALLESKAPELARLCRPRSLIELGSGGSAKTRVILDALTELGCIEVYQPLDVSESALAAAAARLRMEYPGLWVHPVVADFTAELPSNAALPAPRLYAFLGSTIGNLAHGAAVELLRRTRDLLGRVDRFLLGVDLKKEQARLERAYNDAAGVTAEFNLNILEVMNRELGANFNLPAFRHHAFYNQAEARIEMHLVSLTAQQVLIPGAGVYHFRPGESVRTEISCKYDRARVEMLFDEAGLIVEHWWPDEAGDFALVLGAAKG